VLGFKRIGHFLREKGILTVTNLKIMWTIVIALFIGLIVGGCLYGKNFWEKRINVLGISAALMLVSLLTTSFVFRPSIKLTDEVRQRYYIKPMWISEKAQDSTGFVMAKDSSWRITDLEGEALVARGIRTDSIKTDTGVFIKKSYKKEVLIHYILYWNSAYDTAIGYVQVKDNKLDVDYWTVSSDLKVVPIPEGDTVSKPRFESIGIKYAENFKWIVSESIPAWGDYMCLYLPQKEYDALPENVKRTCAFKGRENYLKQLTSK